MVVKVYISEISGNKEIKERQHFIISVLKAKDIKFEIVDITVEGNEEQKEFMQNNAKYKGGTILNADPKYALPPQIFNDKEYCGDFERFDIANETKQLETFLKL